jgi:hypothetical protein
MKRFSILWPLLGLLLLVYGFNLDNATVPRQQILSGGVPKDGIPAILEPVFVGADEASFMDDTDHVIGVRLGTVARAYPVKILNWHEVVNDSVAGSPIVVTF